MLTTRIYTSVRIQEKKCFRQPFCYCDTWLQVKGGEDILEHGRAFFIGACKTCAGFLPDSKPSCHRISLVRQAMRSRVHKQTEQAAGGRVLTKGFFFGNPDFRSFMVNMVSPLINQKGVDLCKYPLQKRFRVTNHVPRMRWVFASNTF